MTFGLTLLPLVMFVGSAVDYSKAAFLQARLQSGVDSTALNLCQAPTSTSAEDMKTQALATVKSFVPTVPLAVDNVVLTNNPRSVVLTMGLDYPTAFMRIAGMSTMKVKASASCSASETYFEVALALDTTGSMASSSGSKSKMEAAKEAGAKFVDYMFTTGALPGHLKMSLVPFAAAVAVNPSTYRSASWLDTGAKSGLHWQNVSGASTAGFASRLDVFTKLKTLSAAWDWAGCVESLPYPLNVEDGAPTASNTNSYFVPLFAPDEVGNSGSSSSNNSYLDDGTSTSGSCQRDDTTTNRFRQACKYASPRNAQTGEYGPNWMCHSRPLTRLGATQAQLKSEIAALQPLGGTNIHEGFMWAWRTLSPLSVFAADASAYGAKNTVKVIVLMSDGENQWLSDSANPLTKSMYSAYGYFKNGDGSTPNSRLPPANANPDTSTEARAAIDALTLQACQNAKAKDIVIYTVGFSTSGDPIDAQGLKILSNCATSPEHTFVANDSTALITAFDRIASGIGQLRLTR